MLHFFQKAPIGRQLGNLVYQRRIGGHVIGGEFFQ